MADIIPKAALDFIKNKNLKVGFSYKDVWNEEHAASFTVAKAMQLDVLSDIHNAVIQAVENGQSFDSFKKNIKPILKQKGWSTRKVTDDRTGQTVITHLGSDRRLRTIYNVNMRSAYQAGQYERTMESDLHPYLMYCTGPSIKHREEHESWNGLILPKDDPWWDDHFPPKGWGCKCYTRAVTEAQLKKYEAEGIPVPPRADGRGGGRLKVKTEAPKEGTHWFYNERKGLLEEIPNGVDPAFNWHVGKAARGKGAEAALKQAERKYANTTKNIVPVMADRQRTAELQQVSTPFFKKLKKENLSAFSYISTYSKGVGSKVNYAINKTDWEKGPFAKLIHSLDDTIAKYPVLDAETWFFKGDNAIHWTTAVVGKSSSPKGFLSTSAIKNRAESYITENRKIKPFMVVIRAPKNTKGLYIGSNTAYNKKGTYRRNEYEYLFPRNTVFKVLEKDKFHIVLEVVVE
ncbi:MAG: phage head morphogenesis protein [Treponema sp.]|jgi:hypothetical protein|nr:phage head morphogenesis protein [Treponema sp.]